MEPLPFSKEASKPTEYFSKQITITGATGVGTSTTMTQLMLVLGGFLWRYVSGGALMREKAKEVGMTIEEFVASDLAYGADKVCDNIIARFGTQNKVVAECRNGHFFIPTAFHVLITCPDKIRASRRCETPDNPKEVQKTLESILKRDADDFARYSKLYSENIFWPESDFDFVIDTSVNTPEEVVKKILIKWEAWKRRPDIKSRLVSSVEMH